MEPIKLKFAQVDEMLKAAIIERQRQPLKFDQGLNLNNKGRALLSALGRDVQSRLWSSQYAEDESH
jgi:hypothetical protein